MTMTLLPSATTATALAAINSIGTATAGSVNAQEMDVNKGKQLLHRDGIKQDQTAAGLTNSAPSIVKQQSTAAMKPDIGILSNDFLKNRGLEQPVGQQFAVHQKKRAAAVDVGILSNGRRQHTPDANLHAISEITGRSLQNEEVLSYMCPGKNGYGGSFYFYYLFNKTDGYFPKCSCPSPTTCGPNLCECLEYADGDILQCMDPFNQLCEGTMYIDGVPGPWSMEQCLGDPYGKFRAIYYCSMLPCFVDGSSISQCQCNVFDNLCADHREAGLCARSKCCQAQTDDEGRDACLSLYGDLYKNYYDEDASFSISYNEMIALFNECTFNSEEKSIMQCYCESFSYRLCVNYGVRAPEFCEAMICCDGQTEDDGRLDCFTTRFRIVGTGHQFHNYRDAVQEICVASGKSSDQCKCDIQGLSNCLFGNLAHESSCLNNFTLTYADNLQWQKECEHTPSCNLFQCCQSQTVDDGRKDCLVQNEAQFVYERCANDGNTTEACVCDKSSNLCSSGHSNDQHCVLSSCCEEQADDTGRKECIGNFTTSQPSSAPSEILADNSIHEDEAEASLTAGDNVSTSSASIISCWIDATMHLVLAAVVGIIWLSQ